MIQTNGKSGNGFSLLNWLGWFLALNLACLLLVAFTAWLGWRSYNLSANGQVVTGIVVRFVEDSEADFFTDIYPVVEFEANGETYSVRSQNNYRWWDRYLRFPVGRQIEMRYDPANPENAEVNSWVDLWVEPLILGVFTFLSAIAGNVFLFLRWRIGRNAQASA